MMETMEIPENHTTHPTEKDKKYNTPLSFRWSKLWVLRIIFYASALLAVIITCYQDFVLHPLEEIKRLNLSDHHFMWNAYRSGIRTSYLSSLFLLFIFFVVEFSVNELYRQDGGYDEKLLKTNRSIRIGIVFTALLLACTLPFIWR